MNEQVMEEYRQQVRELAYQKWTEAGCPPGDGVNYWLEAEEEMAGSTGEVATPITGRMPTQRGGQQQQSQRAAAKKSVH